MKKIPVGEQDKEMTESRPAKHTPKAPEGRREEYETEDPMAGLQADLDRFRDLALRSQADFENYKKRCAREKEEAIKYANNSLLQRLVAIIDNFELGLARERAGATIPDLFRNGSRPETTERFARRKWAATDRSPRSTIRSKSARSNRTRVERRSSRRDRAAPSHSWLSN